jgi:uncharacterized protein (TIGR02246 family)
MPSIILQTKHLKNMKRMKMKIITLTIAAFLFAAAAGYTQTNHLNTKKQETMNTEKITQNILTMLENGWNNANGTEYAQPFADTSEFVDIRGVLHQNSTRQFLGEAHQGVFMGIYKDSKIAYNLAQVIALNENIFVANVKAELDAPAGPLAGKSASTITMVIVKLDNTWKIRAFHNTLVAKQ